MNGFLTWNMIFILVFSITYLIDNIQVMSKATIACYVIGASSLGLSQYLIFLNNKAELKIMFAHLEKIVDESEFYERERVSFYLVYFF